MGADIQIDDEADYAQAARELTAGILREGLWAKSLVECDGDRERAKILYLKYRVALIKKEKRLAAEEARQATEQANQARRAADIADRKHKEDVTFQFFRQYPEAKGSISSRQLDQLIKRFENGENLKQEIQRYVKEQRSFETFVWIANIIAVLAFVALARASRG